MKKHFAVAITSLILLFACNEKDPVLEEIIDIDTIEMNDSTVYLIYQQSAVTISNPYEGQGVTITTAGADVVVKNTSEIRDIRFSLYGKTSNGMFKLYSDKRCYLFLNGVNITNQDGPALNIQSDKKAFIHLIDGTSSLLADGATYTDAPMNGDGLPEDQDAVLFSEGDLEFIGGGSLTITGIGTKKGGIRSDEFIEMISGTIKIVSADKDGIHGKEGVAITGATVSSTAKSGAIDGGGGHILIESGNVTAVSIGDDSNGIDCDSTLTMTGGDVTVTVSGLASKGLKSGLKIQISGGKLTVNTSGGVLLETSGSGSVPSFCSAFKSKDEIVIDGGAITIRGTGIANRGFSADGNFVMTGGLVDISETGNGATYTNENGQKDAYTASCIKGDQDISIRNGALILLSSGTGGKGILCSGNLTIGDESGNPEIGITTSGTKITISTSSGSGGGPGGGQSSGSYDEAKAIKSDGAVLIISGSMNINSADDGIKSPTSITQNGGYVKISNSVEGVESPIITINGGELSIVASDDGFNTTYSTQSGGTEQNDGSLLTINGGYIVSSTSKGDAVDSNGNIKMTGGILIVHGPPSSPEEAVDFNGTFVISGGFLIASGTNSNMNKPMSAGTTQNGLYLTTTSAIAANTVFRIEDSEGKEMVTFKPQRNAYSFLFSSPDFANGSYKIYTGGTCTGSLKDGLYTGGTYSSGTLKKSFTISSLVSTVSF
jgi:trimeric autotransporter adhesin